MSGVQRKNNFEIRTEIKKRNLTFQDVADKMEIYPSTLSRWMRKELTAEQHDRVLNAIYSLCCDVDYLSRTNRG